MKLTYFNGTDEVLVSEFTTYSELIEALRHFMEEHDIVADYCRWVGNGNNSMMIDFGSHYKFFYIDQSFDTIKQLRLNEKQRSNKGIFRRILYQLKQFYRKFILRR